jgi:LacI family transcriptional regulator
MGAIRLKDIAHDLGVSTMTVSKVLRGATDVGLETRLRVLKRMKELNYRPNIMARGLAKGSTFTIGLVVPDLVHPFFAEFAKGLGGALRNARLGLVLASSEEDPESERREIRTLLDRGVDVLIIASCQAKLRNFYELRDDRTPFMLFDRNFHYLSANFVGSDDVLIGEMATGHLIERGCRRIAHLGGQNSSPALDRLLGYRNALRCAGMAVYERLIVTRPRVEESGDQAGFELMQKLLRGAKRPDGVFCYNDLTALGAMDAALKAGLRIPEDIAMIGCGNLRYANYLRVPLSSIDQHAEELGRRAGLMAIDLSEKRDQEPQTILVPPTLVVRESTAASVSARPMASPPSFRREPSSAPRTPSPRT